MQHQLIAEPERLLDAADYWLSTADFENRYLGNDEARAELDQILATAGSVYQVQPGTPPYLARRVSAESKAAGAASLGEGRAGEHLARAWRAVYGRAPDAGGGYSEAVKAVEAAAIPVVSPDNKRATLGTIIADLTNRPDKWDLVFHGSDSAAQVGAVVGVLKLLWTGQSDRHGTSLPDAPLEVTRDQARAAVQLALMLVEWFSHGTIRVSGAVGPSPDRD